MSYLDRGRHARPTSVAAVVAVHVAIGYAFVSGLAYEVVTRAPTIMRGEILPPDALPSPAKLPPPPSAAPHAAAAPAERTIVDIPPVSTVDLTFDKAWKPLVPPVETARLDPPPPAGQARAAMPGAGRAGWVTSDDYPGAALRAEAEGVVGIAVTVGVDGRVADCRVTASSGNADLDAQTCRTYARRARFQPALDDAGRPVASTRADRVRWQLPAG